MGNPVIVDVLRTPFGRRKGWLSGYHPAELLGAVQQGILERNGIDPLEVGQVIGGCVTQAGEQGGNVTRTAWLNQGLPWQVAATTIDSQCASSQQAFHLLAGLISVDAIDMGMACGVESMTRIPLGTNIPEGFGRPKPEGWNIDLPDQFGGTDRIAQAKGISREDLDEFGLRSQQLARAAWDAGYLDQQVLPMASKVRDPEPGKEAPDMVTRDQGLRDTTMEALANLKPVLDGGFHTAGTASQVSDGATVGLIMSDTRAEQLGLRPKARIVAQALVGGEPYFHLDGPIQATQKVLDQTGMTISDIDLVEINEAFASVPISFERHHGVDRDKINVNGGAIAVGHPVGASGVRLLGTLINELERRDLQRGLVTICAGGAMASAAIIERV